MADAIPVASAGLLQAQSTSGMQGAQAYTDAANNLQAQKQQAVQSAMQEAALRGAPAGAAQSQMGMITQPYDTRIASLTQNQAAYSADQASRAQRMQDYSDAVQQARTLVPGEVEQAVAPIRAQGEAAVANTTRQGEMAVAQIEANTRLELAKMAAQQAAAAAARKAAAQKTLTSTQLDSMLSRGTTQQLSSSFGTLGGLIKSNEAAAQARSSQVFGGDQSQWGDAAPEAAAYAKTRTAEVAQGQRNRMEMNNQGYSGVIDPAKINALIAQTTGAPPTNPVPATVGQRPPPTAPLGPTTTTIKTGGGGFLGGGQLQPIAARVSQSTKANLPIPPSPPPPGHPDWVVVHQSAGANDPTLYRTPSGLVVTARGVVASAPQLPTATVTIPTPAQTKYQNDLAAYNAAQREANIGPTATLPLAAQAAQQAQALAAIKQRQAGSMQPLIQAQSDAADTLMAKALGQWQTAIPGRDAAGNKQYTSIGAAQLAGLQQSDPFLYNVINNAPGALNSQTVGSMVYGEPDQFNQPSMYSTQVVQQAREAAARQLVAAGAKINPDDMAAALAGGAAGEMKPGESWSQYQSRISGQLPPDVLAKNIAAQQQAAETQARQAAQDQRTTITNARADAAWNLKYNPDGTLRVDKAAQTAADQQAAGQLESYLGTLPPKSQFGSPTDVMTTIDAGGPGNSGKGVFDDAYSTLQTSYGNPGSMSTKQWNEALKDPKFAPLWQPLTTGQQALLKWMMLNTHLDVKSVAQ
jgi:hypothetical protein